MAEYQSMLPSLGDEYEPDVYLSGKDNNGCPLTPPDDFVIARSAQGEIVSRYGDRVWDLSSYRTTPKGPTRIYFNNWAQSKKPNEKLNKEYKWIIFVLMYFSRSGKVGYLSVGTLMGYSSLVANLCRFSALNKYPLEKVLSEEKTLLQYLKDNQSLNTLNKLAGTIKHLLTLGSDVTGIRVLGGKILEQLHQTIREKDACRKQTSVIPSRIYSGLLTRLHTSINDFLSIAGSFSDLINQALLDSNYARSKSEQSRKGLGINGYRHDFGEAVTAHGLNEYFQRHSVENVKSIVRHIGFVQLACKCLIHAYSGMRDNEVIDLRLNCFQQEEMNSGRRVVRLIGNTTKLIGVRKPVRWVTSKEVETGIEAATTIAQLIGNHVNKDLDNCPLFISTAYLGFCGSKISDGDRIKHSRLSCKKSFITLISGDLRIKNEDLIELEKIDPNRSWRTEEIFQIGCVWPLATHQFRRSLAVYVAQSGLVSLPTLKRQLKHITREMTLYYAKGSAETFGMFGDSKEHFRFEIDKAKPEADALAYIYKVLLSDEELYGAHGVWVEKHNKPEGRLKILENRGRTIKRFKNGEMAYNETALGACTTTSPCDKKSMRAISACITCDKAVIKQTMLKRVITSQKTLVASLHSNTMEFRIENEQLNDLERLYHQTYKRNK